VGNSIGVIAGIVMCNREKYVGADTWIDAIKEETIQMIKRGETNGYQVER